MSFFTDSASDFNGYYPVGDDQVSIGLGPGSALGLGLGPQQPAGRLLSNKGVVAVDITERFREAAQTLPKGELVKDAFFTLFESVGALEIMDPKMDSGCVKDGEELDETYDVSRPLEPAEVLGIIDQLLSHEMAWHLGYPLAQTVLTSVYAEALLMPTPSSMRETDFVRTPYSETASSSSATTRHPMLTVLRAYCVGLLKACGMVIEHVISEPYYEEEDFVTHTCDRLFLANISLNDIRQAIAEAQTILSSDLPIVTSTSEDIIQGLQARLQLRLAWLDIIEAVSPDETGMDSDMSSGGRWDPYMIRRPWQMALDLLPMIEKSHALEIPVPEACSAKLQRKLASTTPPRPIVQLKFADALQHLKHFCRDGAEAIDVLKSADSQSLLAFVSMFHSKKPQPLTYIRTYIQTLLVKDNLFLGSISIRQVLDEDLSIITLPASPLLDPHNDEIEAVHSSRFIVADQMELFRQRAAQVYISMLRTFCQNRCRVRRTLFHSVQEWESLQLDAEEIDQVIQMHTRESPIMLHPGSLQQAAPSDPDDDEQHTGPPAFHLPLSSWTHLYKVKIMEWMVQLGFELEIYQPNEMAGMYWYLHYLAKMRVQHVERIKTFLTHTRDTPATQLYPGLIPHTPHANPRPSAADQQQQLDQTAFARALDFNRLSMLDAAVTWELADALSCLYLVLARLGLTEPVFGTNSTTTAVPRENKTPWHPTTSTHTTATAAASATDTTPALEPYRNDALRYQLRMRPFAPSSVGFPALPEFPEFIEATQQAETSTTVLLAYAQRAAASARRGLEVLVRATPDEAFAAEATEFFTASSSSSRSGGSGGAAYARWLADGRRWLKASIAVGLAVMEVRWALDGEDGEDGQEQQQQQENEQRDRVKARIKVDVPLPGDGYHDWWIVPQITRIGEHAQ